MASKDDSQTTTFGAIIERKGPSPSQSSTPPGASSSGIANDSLAAPQPYKPQAIPAALHLASSTQSTEQPLPTPYSMKDSAHEKGPDLEAGLYVAPTAVEKPKPVATDKPATATLTPIVVRTSTPSRQISSASTASSSTAGGAGDEKLVDARTREIAMWPTQDNLRQRAKQEKRARVWNPMRRLSKRNRVIVSVVIALTVIAAAVGIGVGVSRAYHGEVWAGQGKGKPIQS